jgi:hypothetical protein
MNTNNFISYAQGRAWMFGLTMAMMGASVWPACGGNEISQNKGKAPSIANRPVIEPRNSDGSGSTDKGKPAVPGRPDKVAPSPAVKELVDKFQDARETYLEGQRQLRIQLRSATEQEREIIRQQMREGLDRWKEQTRQFAEEARESAHKMKDKLGPELDRVIDRGKDEGRNR